MSLREPDEVWGPTPRRVGSFLFEAQRAFSFLAAEWGFELVRADQLEVRYESANCYVVVSLDRVSLEALVHVDVLEGGTRYGYGLGALIRVQDPGVAAQFRYPVLDNIETHRSLLTDVASLFRAYGKKAASGNREFFAAAALAREEAKRQLERMTQPDAEHTLEARAERARARANRAFELGHFNVAADVFSSLGESLSRAERKKLKVAQKMLKRRR